MSDVVVSVENLETSFATRMGEVKAVNGISYEVRKGRTLGVVGESGCGKSVTSLSIMGLLDHPGKVTGGRVLFHGEDLTKATERRLQDLRGNRIAMIFQEPMTALNPVLTVGEQIDEQVRRHRKCNKNEARARTLEVLDLVGIPSPAQRAADYPHQLSGGMRQRAMIAMALSCEPEFLIADEPTTALDVTIQAQILELIRSLQDRMHMAVQFITHDLAVISEIADDVCVMYAGRMFEKAPATELFRNPRQPYTVALLESIPRIGQRHERLNSIKGSVPSLYALPRGCPFQNRCPRVTDACLETFPPLTQLAREHFVACHNPA